MYGFAGKLEASANIAIIVLALLFGFVLIEKSFFSTHVAEPPMGLQPATGTKVDLSGEDWSKQPKTLILALQTTCHFCNESAAFYKRIIDEVQAQNIKLIAVLPTGVEESKAHLDELGLNGIEIKSMSLDRIRVGGTPTLILTNDKGEITDFWVGKLTPDKELEVINKINS